jgi:hypothetical protein
MPEDLRNKYLEARAEFLKLWYKPDKNITDIVRMNELEDELDRIESEERK